MERDFTALPGCDLLSGLFDLLVHVERQPVRNVILVDVAYVIRRFDADLLGRYDLDIVEPLVWIEAAPFRFLVVMVRPSCGVEKSISQSTSYNDHPRIPSAMLLHISRNATGFIRQV